MEAVVGEQSISACKQMKMMMRTSSIPYSSPYSENLAPINYNIHRGGGRGGLLHAPPPPPSLSFSTYTSSPSVFNHYRYQQLQQVQRHQQQHPPLLPLPVHHHHSLPSLPSLPSRTRSISRSTTARKTNMARSQSLTPKKPKSKAPSKKEEAKQAECLITAASTNRLGPDPNDLPKDVTKVLMMTSSSIGEDGTLGVGGVVVGDMEKFSGSIFTLSPPPSSLPLPKFSMRRRLSCNAEAAGVDTGATDNLCRLLRLR